MPVDCKEVVRRFNIEVIRNGNEMELRALTAPHFVNYAAPPGAPNGPESIGVRSRMFFVRLFEADGEDS